MHPDYDGHGYPPVFCPGCWEVWRALRMEPYEVALAVVNKLPYPVHPR